jgi:hypothetical protein
MTVFSNLSLALFLIESSERELGSDPEVLWTLLGDAVGIKQRHTWMQKHQQ